MIKIQSIFRMVLSVEHVTGLFIEILICVSFSLLWKDQKKKNSHFYLVPLFHSFPHFRK